MRHRVIAVVLSACALSAVAPSAAPAAGPPDVSWVGHCFDYAGPPNGPVDPALSVAGCFIRHLT
jgi:hypothetical protein